eukprot:365523-Chlamydomonas_euryale.AAC.3
MDAVVACSAGRPHFWLRLAAVGAHVYVARRPAWAKPSQTRPDRSTAAEDECFALRCPVLRCWLAVACKSLVVLVLHVRLLVFGSVGYAWPLAVWELASLWWCWLYMAACLSLVELVMHGRLLFGSLQVFGGVGYTWPLACLW